MARNTSTVLDAGDAFPSLSGKVVGGASLELPRAFEESWSVFLAYRGHW